MGFLYEPEVFFTFEPFLVDVVLFYFWADTSMCPRDLGRKRVVPEVYGDPIPASVVAPGAG